MKLYEQYTIGNGKIPDAPKMPSKQAPAQKITKFPKALISKSAGSKTQNPPQLPAMSAREELMMAIRNRGGVQGLRKVTLLKKDELFYLPHLKFIHILIIGTSIIFSLPYILDKCF